MQDEAGMVGAQVKAVVRVRRVEKRSVVVCILVVTWLFRRMW